MLFGENLYKHAKFYINVAFIFLLLILLLELRLHVVTTEINLIKCYSIYDYMQGYFKAVKFLNYYLNQISYPEIRVL